MTDNDPNSTSYRYVPAVVIELAAIALAAVMPGPGAVLSGAVVVGKLLGDDKRKELAAETFRRGIEHSFKACHGRIEGIEDRVRSLDAEEAWVKGARAALLTAKLDKARRMGQILGSTLAADSPNWVEAAEFIATIEEFGDDDIRAIKIMWPVQRTAMRVRNTAGELKMSTDANDYTSSWKQVLERAAKANFDLEEWYSTCGRLGGFGLVLPVQPNQAHQGPDATCYRLTTKATRLLRSLGFDADPRAYPKVVRNNGQERTVQDQDEHLALGEGWI